MTKTALIVSPYLDHLGGGERYMLTCAQALQSLGYAVDIGWDNLDSLRQISSLLGLNLAPLHLNPPIKALYHSRNPLAMYRATRPYGVVLYLSDGSIPLLGGQKNILHLQVPFHNVGGRSWKNQLKLKTINAVVVNSHFTKRIVDREYGINSTVLYPPVPQLPAHSKKAPLILSVGRFEPSLNAKKQDILIEAFKKLSPQLPDWQLVLIGGSSGDDWVKHLKHLAAGYPITILPNAEYAVLQKLYSQASLYWHAAGYGVDEKKNPELVEHFGISTVEAISAQVIPLVYRAGGQPEIVKNPELLWDTVDELLQKTLALTKRSFSDYAASLPITAYSESAFTHHLSSLL